MNIKHSEPIMTSKPNYRMNLNRVTLTGVDESVPQEALVELAHEFPFVEWGVLIKSSGARRDNRYPEFDWIENLTRRSRKCTPPLNLALHVCGDVVNLLFSEHRKDLIRFFCEEPQQNSEYATRIDNFENVLSAFQRIQINFTASRFREHYASMAPALKSLPGNHQFIIQILSADADPSRENVAVGNMLRDEGVDVVFLHDASGGHGIAPDHWQAPWGNYCGYAGGLTPEALEESLERITIAAGKTLVWIDMESGIRTEGRFDLTKARRMLEITRRWICD